MGFVSNKIKGLFFILVALAIIEIIISFIGSKEISEMIVTIIVQFLQFFLFLFLMVILNKILRQSADKEKQYRELLDLSPEAIYVHRNGVVVYSNEAGAKLFGFNEPLELVNLSWKEILNAKSYESLRASSDRYEIDQQFKIHHFNLYDDEGGTERYIEAKSTYILFDGEAAREVIARDITVQETNKQRLKKLSYIDALTQIPNRRSLLEQLEQIIKESKQNNKSFGIMFVDLDGFKQINDTYGHSKGDFLLKQVSKYLKLSVREEDIVGRFGGDEFIIILPYAVQTDCISIAKKIIDNMPLFISDFHNQVTVSIGIALYPQNGNDLDTIMKQADKAMYNAKKLGKNNYQFFEIGI